MRDFLIFIVALPVVPLVVVLAWILAIVYVLSVYVLALPIITACWLSVNCFVFLLYCVRGQYKDFTIKATPWMILKQFV